MITVTDSEVWTFKRVDGGAVDKPVAIMSAKQAEAEKTPRATHFTSGEQTVVFWKGLRRRLKMIKG